MPALPPREIKRHKSLPLLNLEMRERKILIKEIRTTLESIKSQAFYCFPCEKNMNLNSPPIVHPTFYDFQYEHI